MKQSAKNRSLEVETDEAIYEIRFGQIQIEITGKCNMRCQHCRASNQVNRDMPIHQIVKILLFARQFSSDDEEIVLSGGEPLMHKQFSEVLREVRANGGRRVTLTTNGSLLTEAHLQIVEQLNFASFAFSVSLDSIDPETHDRFRGHRGSFDKANRTLGLITRSDISGMIPSIRSTIDPSRLGEMEDLVKYAMDSGCKRIGFSAVHPAGRAADRQDLWLSKEQKKKFLYQVYELRDRYRDISVSTSDPLKCLVAGLTETKGNNELVFDGCGAAAVTFNVNADGTMTPCALLDIAMMNVFLLTIKEMNESYQKNEVVENMLTLNLKGKCRNCQIKYQCGGCRARALIQNGDYLQEDPHCWAKP